MQVWEEMSVLCSWYSWDDGTHKWEMAEASGWLPFPPEGKGGAEESKAGQLGMLSNFR